MPDAPDERERALLMQLIFGFFPSAVVFVAARLKIPDLLAEAPKTSAELANATGTHEPSIDRLLRALVYLGVLRQPERDRFELTGVGAMLRSGAPDSARETALLFGGEGVWRSWGELLSSVTTGEPVYPRIFGEEPMAPGRDAAEFNRAMAEGTRQVAAGLIGAYDFSKFTTLVDVGGGNGTLLGAILAANPELHGVLFDMPVGLAEADDVLTALNVANRCDLVPGDFFERVPSGADAYLMKSVIHDWDDERCVTILRNCREAMADAAKVLILEPVLPAVAQPSFVMLGTIMSDLNMLVCTGGRERTEADFAALLDAAGLRLTTITPVPGPTVNSLIEAQAT